MSERGSDKVKKIRETRLVDYCDGPVVIEAQDDDGRRYLCDVLSSREDGMRFIVVPVTDSQVDTLNRGETCLRRTLLHAGQNKWYVSVPQWDFGEPFAIERQSGPIADSPDLPGEGYMLTGAWDH